VPADPDLSLSTDLVTAPPTAEALPSLPDPTILAGQLMAASIREYRKDIATYLA
jgi:hypothetical protein